MSWSRNVSFIKILFWLQLQLWRFLYQKLYLHKHVILYISGGRRRHSRPTLSDILFTLSSAMSLLRRCRVNAALTIQVFSQLFHYINMWIFNKLVLQPQLGLCTRDWGHRLRRRLGRVESWAQKQGLELAADSHLCRVVQVRIWVLFIPMLHCKGHS